MSDVYTYLNMYISAHAQRQPSSFENRKMEIKKIEFHDVLIYMCYTYSVKINTHIYTHTHTHIHMFYK